MQTAPKTITYQNLVDFQQMRYGGVGTGQPINRQVQGIQASTDQAVAAIQGIAGALERIEETVNAVAGATEQQVLATHGMADGLRSAAHDSAAVSQTMATGDNMTGETGTAAHQVLEAAGAVDQQARLLRQEVDSFLAGVRAA